MALNIAEPILGGIYTLYVDALGCTAAWWIGHLTLIGTIMLTYWAIKNWSNISHGLGLSRSRVVALLVLITFTGIEILLFRDQLGFPMAGALFTSGTISFYLWWQWYQIEPQKA